MNTNRVLMIAAAMVAVLFVAYYVLAPGGVVPPKSAVGEASQPAPAKTQ